MGKGEGDIRGSWQHWKEALWEASSSAETQQGENGKGIKLNCSEMMSSQNKGKQEADFLNGDDIIQPERIF